MKLNKKQKRTATIASMAALLAVVLGMGGQTFAKYYDSKEVTAQATVAKWGYVITTNAENLFGTDYTSGVIVTSGGKSVSASSTGNVVAPGTSGSVTFSVNGTPEVSSKVTISVTGDAIGIYDSTGITYEPIRWTLKKDGFDVAGATNVDFETLKTKVANESNQYAPKAPVEDEYEISWKWAFANTDSSTDDDHIDNAKDTLLGNNAGTNDATYKTLFDFNLNIVVEQTEVYTGA